MDTVTDAEITARMNDWQRIASDPARSADLRRTARRAVRLHRDELKRRSA